jgi:hypothetical protein
MAFAAERTANIKPGKDPEAPTAMVSLESTPALLSSDTSNPAKLGFVLVLLASRLPRVVVKGEDLTPMIPVRFTSEEESMSRFFASRQSLRISIASDMICEAAIISSLRALASWDGMILAIMKNTRLRTKSPNRSRFFWLRKILFGIFYK